MSLKEDLEKCVVEGRPWLKDPRWVRLMCEIARGLPRWQYVYYPPSPRTCAPGGLGRGEMVNRETARRRIRGAKVFRRERALRAFRCLNGGVLEVFHER